MKPTGKILIPVLVILLQIALLISLNYIELTEKTIDLVKKIVNISLTFTIAWLFMALINLGKRILIKNIDLTQKDNYEARKIFTRFSILEKILFVIIIFIAIAAALMNFESIRKLGISLFASAGIAGIIIGLAAQKIIGTFLAGIQLAITQPIKIDDVVIIENEWGRIEEINLTFVVVRIWDKRRLIVPTTYFIENPFQNWTKVSADILGTVFIYTDYTVPFNEVRKKLEELVRENAEWDGQVAIMQVTGATETTIEMRILVSAKDSPSAWNLRVFLREKLIAFIQENYPECLPKTRIVINSGTQKPGMTEG